MGVVIMMGVAKCSFFGHNFVSAGASLCELCLCPLLCMLRSIGTFVSVHSREISCFWEGQLSEIVTDYDIMQVVWWQWC